MELLLDAVDLMAAVGKQQDSREKQHGWQLRLACNTCPRQCREKQHASAANETEAYSARGDKISFGFAIHATSIA